MRLALKQENGNINTHDGIDISLCLLELQKQRVTYAGARRPLYIVKNGITKSSNERFLEVKGDRKSIGGRQKEEKRIFTNHELKLQKNDMIYLTSDGFVDQQNNENRKYSTKSFKSFIESIAKFDTKDQINLLQEELTKHQGNGMQRDDITIIGIKV